MNTCPCSCIRRYMDVDSPSRDPLSTPPWIYKQVVSVSRCLPRIARSLLGGHCDDPFEMPQVMIPFLNSYCSTVRGRHISPHEGTRHWIGFGFMNVLLLSLNAEYTPLLTSGRSLSPSCWRIWSTSGRSSRSTASPGDIRCPT